MKGCYTARNFAYSGRYKNLNFLKDIYFTFVEFVEFFRKAKEIRLWGVEMSDFTSNLHLRATSL